MTRAAIIVFGVHGKAQEKYIDHVLKNREETVCHQKRKQTNYEKRKDPHSVLPLVVQGQDAGKSGAGHYKHLCEQVRKDKAGDNIKTDHHM